MGLSDSGAVTQTVIQQLRDKLRESLEKVESLNRELRAESSRSKKLHREYQLAMENLSQLPLPFHDDSNRIPEQPISGR